MGVGSTIRQEEGGLDARKTWLSVPVPPPTSYSDLTKSPHPCTDPWTSCPPCRHKWAPLPLWLPGQPVQPGTKMQAVTWRQSPQKLRAWGPGGVRAGLAWPLHVHTSHLNMQVSVGVQSPNSGLSTGTKTWHLGRREGSCREAAGKRISYWKERPGRLTEHTHRGHCPQGHQPGQPPSKVASKLQTQEVNRDLGFRYTAWKTHKVQVTGNSPLSLSSFMTLKGIWESPQWGWETLLWHHQWNPNKPRCAGISRPPCASSPPDGAAHQQSRDPIQDYKSSF